MKKNQKKTIIVNKTLHSGSWFFQNDHVANYAWAKNVLSREDCEKIINIGNNLRIEQAKVGNEKENINYKVRKSNVSWILPNKDTEWIFIKIQKAIETLNKEFFKFHITGINEGFQFTKYEAPDGHYDTHMDKVYQNIIRKLSLTIQLSDPKNYEGGNLQIIEGADDPLNMEKEIGMAVVFPSYILHKVTPVTRGERYSLVGWFSGDPFK